MTQEQYDKIKKPTREIRRQIIRLYDCEPAKISEKDVRNNHPEIVQMEQNLNELYNKIFGTSDLDFVGFSIYAYPTQSNIEDLIGGMKYDKASMLQD